MDFKVSYKQFLPIGKGAVLLTTQIRDAVADAGKIVTLRPLSQEEGSKLLLSYITDHVESRQSLQAQDICKKLGGHSLGIVHVAGFLEQSSMPLENFRGKWMSHECNQIDVRETALTHQWQTTGDSETSERTYAQLWSSALSNLESSARETLNILAFFNPDSVPEQMLLHVTGGEASTQNYSQIKLLQNRSLIESATSDEGAKTVSLHRLL